MPDDVTWLPVCAGLSALGVIVAFLAFRRRGFAAGLRLLGWSALPMAAYLTGVVTLLWQIGADIAHFAVRFAFSMTVWLGVGVFGLAVVLFVISGVLRARRGGSAAGSAPATGSASTGGSVAPVAGRSSPAHGKEQQPAAGSGSGKAEVGQGAETDEPVEGMDDIEEILRRRGIS